MKSIQKIQLSLVFLFVIALSMTSCSKSFKKGTIDRDCTGTYLKWNDNDYLICNPEITNSIADGSAVQVKFKTTTICPSNSVSFSCELYHLSAGYVEIIEIK